MQDSDMTDHSPTAHDRIRVTWALAAADAPRVGRLFYSNLFRLDPSTKPLFIGDLDLQGRKLTSTLSFIVDALDAPETLGPAAMDLAKRHVAYGVAQEHYGAVGASLITTLKHLLGPAFAPEDEAAWRTTYGALSATMIAAAYPERARPAPAPSKRLKP
jgi:hemoglobin-like flavoprotein